MEVPCLAAAEGKGRALAAWLHLVDLHPTPSSPVLTLNLEAVEHHDSTLVL